MYSWLYLKGYPDTFCAEAATKGVILKKAFLKISQNSQENTCAKASI